MQTLAQGDFRLVAVWFPRGIIVTPELCGGIPRSQMPQKVVKKTSALILL